jgi:hypothetical protein
LNDESKNVPLGSGKAITGNPLKNLLNISSNSDMKSTGKKVPRLPQYSDPFLSLSPKESL